MRQLLCLSWRRGVRYWQPSIINLDVFVFLLSCLNAHPLTLHLICLHKSFSLSAPSSAGPPLSVSFVISSLFDSPFSNHHASVPPSPLPLPHPHPHPPRTTNPRSSSPLHPHTTRPPVTFSLSPLQPARPHVPVATRSNHATLLDRKRLSGAYALQLPNL